MEKREKNRKEVHPSINFEFDPLPPQKKYFQYIYLYLTNINLYYLTAGQAAELLQEDEGLQPFVLLRVLDEPNLTNVPKKVIYKTYILYVQEISLFAI